MFDTIWIARVVPSRANTSQTLIDTGKLCDICYWCRLFSATFGRYTPKRKKKLTYQVRERDWNGLHFKDLIKTFPFPSV